MTESLYFYYIAHVHVGTMFNYHVTCLRAFVQSILNNRSWHLPTQHLNEEGLVIMNGVHRLKTSVHVNKYARFWHLRKHRATRNAEVIISQHVGSNEGKCFTLQFAQRYLERRLVYTSTGSLVCTFGMTVKFGVVMNAKFYALWWTLILWASKMTWKLNVKNVMKFRNTVRN